MRRSRRRLAEAGSTVTVADRNAKTAEGVASEIRADGGDAAGRACDVRDQEDVRSLFASGSHDILVNNAGVFSNVLVDAMAPEEFMRIQEVNVLGAFLCAQAFARSKPTMSDRWRAIVNVASVDAMRPSAQGLVHYTTSKHAVAGLTRESRDGTRVATDPSERGLSWCIDDRGRARAHRGRRRGRY